ncbi:hypothetical protein [Porphyromonas phage phage019b_ATCC49417]|uniref:Uncharacterized protein n=1 Tax=Porphyromonas phage phage019a_ATCC49417 TaxID=3154109 RepID=A0AAT9JD23_9VIRU
MPCRKKNLRKSCVYNKYVIYLYCNQTTGI